MVNYCRSGQNVLNPPTEKGVLENIAYCDPFLQQFLILQRIGCTYITYLFDIIKIVMRNHSETLSKSIHAFEQRTTSNCSSSGTSFTPHDCLSNNTQQALQC